MARWFAGLTRGALTCALTLLVTNSAHAEEATLGVDLSAGILGLGEGPARDDVGTTLDLNLLWRALDHLMLRGGFGLLTTYNLHLAPDNYARVRAEAAVGTQLGKIEPLLGLGGTLSLGNTSLHALGGLGLELTPGWTLAVDLRAGAFSEIGEGARTGWNRMLEGQLRLSVDIN